MPDIGIVSLHGKKFGAYAALPKGGNGAGMIVIQEIFGVNAGMRKICDDFAEQGYIAVCPDLFWRQEPNVQLSDKTEEEWAKAFALYKGFDIEAGVRDLLSTLAHIRGLSGCSGKVGAVGYCLGGKLAYLMATRSDVDCSVSYYGVGIETMLDEVPDIRLPLLMHIAEKDKFVPPEARKKILDRVAHNNVITAYTYPADHAFARPGGQSFDADCTRVAGERTQAFFAEHLRSG